MYLTLYLVTLITAGATTGRQSMHICGLGISPAQVRRMVPADGVTDTTVGRFAAPFAEAGSDGCRKLPPPALQAPGSPPTVVTVQQALGVEAWTGTEPALLSPLPLRRAPLVTTASRPLEAHASASAADPSCAAAAPPGLEVSGRQHSAEACVDM